MILTIYDLSGIQDYIFATNKMKDMIGGSVIVNRALFRNIPCLFEDKPVDESSRTDDCMDGCTDIRINDCSDDTTDKRIDDWMQLDHQFTFSDSDKHKIVYIGGGNALVAYDSQETAQEYTRKLQKLIFSQAGGALKLCYASLEYDNDQSLADNQKQLMQELDINKRRTPKASTAGGFSINAHDNSTFEPILLFGTKFTSKSRYQKLEMAKKVRPNAEKKTGAPKIPYFASIHIEGLEYVTDFEKFRKDEQKNYLAVIHIDGNTMGMRIREFTQKLRSGGAQTDLDALRRLSAEINKAYRETLRCTIKEVYSGKIGDIPFRPVILDGDDVTVICAAEDAFTFVRVFMDELSKRELDSLKEQGIHARLTAGSGIAFVKHKFPFYTAYEIAEELCKNAKSKALQLGYIGDNSRSSVDYHVCYSGVTDDVSEFRQRNYKFGNYRLIREPNKSDTGEEHGLYRLNRRPYIFNADEEHSFYDFEKGFENVSKEIIGKIANSKLKGLRQAYGEGGLAAEVYGDFLKSRHTGEPDESVANMLADPFETIGREKVGKFFDVLDVLDFLQPEAEAAAEAPEAGDKATERGD